MITAITATDTFLEVAEKCAQAIGDLVGRRSASGYDPAETIRAYALAVKTLTAAAADADLIRSSRGL